MVWGYISDSGVGDRRKVPSDFDPLWSTNWKASGLLHLIHFQHGNDPKHAAKAGKALKHKVRSTITHELAFPTLLKQCWIILPKKVKPVVIPNLDFQAFYAVFPHFSKLQHWFPILTKFKEMRDGLRLLHNTVSIDFKSLYLKKKWGYVASGTTRKCNELKCWVWATDPVSWNPKMLLSCRRWRFRPSLEHLWATYVIWL